MILICLVFILFVVPPVLLGVRSSTPPLSVLLSPSNPSTPISSLPNSPHIIQLVRSTSEGPRSIKQRK